MTKSQSLRWEFLAACSGPVFEVLYALTWAVLACNLPPPSAALSASDLAAFYTQHQTRILAGNALAALVGVLWMPWTAQLAVVMRRIETEAPVLTLIQLMGGALTTWVLVASPAIWAIPAFRPDLPPAVIQALNDLGFFTFFLTYAVTALQAIAAGFVGLADRSAHPVFPRWVSRYAIFTGVAFVPLTLMPFFKTGPLAWDGLFNFWIVLGAYFVWSGTMGFAMIKDVRRRMHADAPGVAPAAAATRAA